MSAARARPVRAEGDRTGTARGRLDDAAFDALVALHRRELRVHCYRLVGSFDDSEDLVQETFLRAWDKRRTFEGRAAARTWLYRIATNACLDFLERASRRPRPQDPSAERAALASGEIPWLQPYPDRLLGPLAPPGDEPHHAAETRETIELAFLAALQHLPPRQRAVLILRDVLGWTAKDTASALHTTAASANSALQRARAALKDRLPARRSEWPAEAGPEIDAADRELVRRFTAAVERADSAAVVELLGADARMTMPPQPDRYLGREAIGAFLDEVFDPVSPLFHGAWRHLPAAANRGPAAAAYVRRGADGPFRAQVLEVFRVEDGAIAEITGFVPALFPAFGLPSELPPEPSGGLRQ